MTSIEGVVTDAATGDPVEDATVTAEQTVRRFAESSVLESQRCLGGLGELDVRGFPPIYFEHLPGGSRIGGSRIIDLDDVVEIPSGPGDFYLGVETRYMYFYYFGPSSFVKCWKV